MSASRFRDREQARAEAERKARAGGHDHFVKPTAYGYLVCGWVPTKSKFGRVEVFHCDGKAEWVSVRHLR